MYKSIRWTAAFTLVAALLGGCGEDGAPNGAGFGGTAGSGGMGRDPARTCGPDAVCETEGLVCDIGRGRCVKPLRTTRSSA
jgi:hypothetical protein